VSRRQASAWTAVTANLVCLTVACQVAPATPKRVPEALLEELRPVALKNCTIRRFGSEFDGGYLLCENLLEAVESAYSYGIDLEDNWGCEVSNLLRVPVHQYDCFTPHRPQCTGGQFVFHNECVGPATKTEEGRVFDTLTGQIARNGDAQKHLLVKIDIEGAEWESLMATPDEVLDRIDQMPMELHGVHEERFLEVLRRLKEKFYIVSVHFNNRACTPDAAPLPGWAYQVLFVNKRIGVLDPSAAPRLPGSPPDAPDDPHAPDCQPRW
jgi:hypothetical protein